MDSFPSGSRVEGGKKTGFATHSRLGNYVLHTQPQICVIVFMRKLTQHEDPPPPRLVFFVFFGLNEDVILKISMSNFAMAESVWLFMNRVCT